MDPLQYINTDDYICTKDDPFESDTHIGFLIETGQVPPLEE